MPTIKTCNGCLFPAKVNFTAESLHYLLCLKIFGITTITNTCAGHNDDFRWSVAQAILVSGVRVTESRLLGNIVTGNSDHNTPPPHNHKTMVQECKYVLYRLSQQPARGRTNVLIITHSSIIHFGFVI